MLFMWVTIAISRDLVYLHSTSDRGGQGLGQAMSGVLLAYGLARETNRSLCIDIRMENHNIAEYLVDRGQWARECPSAGKTYYYWNFGYADSLKQIEAAAHSSLPVIALRGNERRAKDTQLGRLLFTRVFRFPEPVQFDVQAVVHLRLGDSSAGWGSDVRRILRMSHMSTEEAVDNAIKCARRTIPQKTTRTGGYRIMFLSDTEAAKNYASRLANVITRKHPVKEPWSTGPFSDVIDTWKDAQYMITAPVFVHTQGAFGEFCARANPHTVVQLESWLENNGFHNSL